MKFYRRFCQKYPQLAEIVRFIIVGGGATLVDMFVMGVVLYLMQPNLYPNFFNAFFGGGEPSTLATIIGTGVGFLAGLLFNYILSIIFVFEEKGNSKSVRGFIIFTILSAGGLLIHLLGMYLGYDCWHINQWVIKIILTLVVLVYNYITRKIFLFKKLAPSQETEQA